MRARRDAALRLLKTMLAASIVIPVALFSYASWINYRDTIAHADEQLTASLNILSEHASKVFQSVDLAPQVLTPLPAIFPMNRSRPDRKRYTIN